MSNNTFKLISERKKEEKKQRENREEIGSRRERERDRKGQRTEGMASMLELADRPDLTLVRDRGQGQ